MGTNDEVVRVVSGLTKGFERALGEHESEVTLSQFRLLAFLDEGERAASALADWLEVSRPSITSLVDGLVERGWVAREHSPTDRRRVLHTLTTEGRARLAEAGEVIDGVLDDLLSHLDPDEQTRARDGLSLLVTAHRRRKAGVPA